MTNEYQDLWDSLLTYLKENRDQDINVGRIILMMELMEKARVA